MSAGALWRSTLVQHPIASFCILVLSAVSYWALSTHKRRRKASSERKRRRLLGIPDNTVLSHPGNTPRPAIAAHHYKTLLKCFLGTVLSAMPRARSAAPRASKGSLPPDPAGGSIASAGTSPAPGPASTGGDNTASSSSSINHSNTASNDMPRASSGGGGGDGAQNAAPAASMGNTTALLVSSPSGVQNRARGRGGKGGSTTRSSSSSDHHHQQQQHMVNGKQSSPSTQSRQSRRNYKDGKERDHVNGSASAGSSSGNTSDRGRSAQKGKGRETVRSIGIQVDSEAASDMTVDSSAIGASQQASMPSGDVSSDSAHIADTSKRIGCHKDTQANGTSPVLSRPSAGLLPDSFPPDSTASMSISTSTSPSRVSGRKARATLNRQTSRANVPGLSPSSASTATLPDQDHAESPLTRGIAVDADGDGDAQAAADPATGGVSPPSSSKDSAAHPASPSTTAASGSQATQSGVGSIFSRDPSFSSSGRSASLSVSTDASSVLDSGLPSSTASLRGLGMADGARDAVEESRDDLDGAPGYSCHAGFRDGSGVASGQASTLGSYGPQQQRSSQPHYLPTPPDSERKLRMDRQNGYRSSHVPSYPALSQSSRSSSSATPSMQQPYPHQQQSHAHSQQAGYQPVLPYSPVPLTPSLAGLQHGMRYGASQINEQAALILAYQQNQQQQQQQQQQLQRQQHPAQIVNHSGTHAGPSSPYKYHNLDPTPAPATSADDGDEPLVFPSLLSPASLAQPASTSSPTSRSTSPYPQHPHTAPASYSSANPSLPVMQSQLNLQQQSQLVSHMQYVQAQLQANQQAQAQYLAAAGLLATQNGFAAAASPIALSHPHPQAQSEHYASQHPLSPLHTHLFQPVAGLYQQQQQQQQVGMLPSPLRSPSTSSHGMDSPYAPSAKPPWHERYSRAEVPETPGHRASMSSAASVASASSSIGPSARRKKVSPGPQQQQALYELDSTSVANAGTSPSYAQYPISHDITGPVNELPTDYVTAQQRKKTPRRASGKGKLSGTAHEAPSPSLSYRDANQQFDSPTVGARGKRPSLGPSSSTYSASEDRRRRGSAPPSASLSRSPHFKSIEADRIALADDSLIQTDLDLLKSLEGVKEEDLDVDTLRNKVKSMEVVLERRGKELEIAKWKLKCVEVDKRGMQLEQHKALVHFAERAERAEARIRLLESGPTAPSAPSAQLNGDSAATYAATSSTGNTAGSDALPDAVSQRAERDSPTDDSSAAKPFSTLYPTRPSQPESTLHNLAYSVTTPNMLSHEFACSSPVSEYPPYPFPKSGNAARSKRGRRKRHTSGESAASRSVTPVDEDDSILAGDARSSLSRRKDCDTSLGVDDDDASRLDESDDDDLEIVLDSSFTRSPSVGPSNDDFHSAVGLGFSLPTASITSSNSDEEERNSLRQSRSASYVGSLPSFKLSLPPTSPDRR